MGGTVSRGDALKIDSMPQAIVATAGILATAGVIVFLAMSGWSGEAIGAFASLAIGIIASQFVNARKTAVVEAKTDAQTEQLDTIVRQTNGLTERQLDEVADRAALKMVQLWRSGELPR